MTEESNVKRRPLKYFFRASEATLHSYKKAKSGTTSKEKWYSGLSIQSSID